MEPKRNLFKYINKINNAETRLGRLACPVTANRHYGGAEAEGGVKFRIGPGFQQRSSVLQDCWYSETGQGRNAAALSYVDGAYRNSRAEEKIR